MSLTFIVDAANYVTTHWMAHRGGAKQLVEMIKAFEQKFNPAVIRIVFDGGAPYVRRELFPDYKANRKPKDELLIKELGQARLFCFEEGYTVHHQPGVEADDRIATLTSWAVNSARVVIYSKDKDMWQLLIKDKVTILNNASRKGQDWSWEFFTEDNLFCKTGLTPAQWIDYQALVGESDGWQGADGIGEVTASKLLKAYGNIEAMQRATIDSSEIFRVKLTARQFAGLNSLDVSLARKIVTLRKDLPL